MRRLLLTGALANLALTATEVALTGYVRQHHALWASGPLLAEVSIGSIVGSLLLGARAKGAGEADERRRLPWLLACYALGLAALAAATLQVPLVAVAAPVAGLCLGPTLATLFGLASSAAPGGGTEAQSWLNSAMNGGAAAGAALAGVTAGAPPLSLAVAAGVAALAAGTAVAGRVRPPRYTECQRDEVPHPGQAHDPSSVHLDRPSSVGGSASDHLVETSRSPAIPPGNRAGFRPVNRPESRAESRADSWAESRAGPDANAANLD